MTDQINYPALITRAVLIQNAKTDLEAATAEESALLLQIQDLHNKQMQASARKQEATRRVEQATAIPEADLPVNAYRKVSLIEQEAMPERTRVKSAAFDYLFANQDASFETIANLMDTEGGSDRMHNYSGVLKAYMRNALTAGMVANDTWESFRAFILSIGKEQVLNL
jgi:hypothetical protein